MKSLSFKASVIWICINLSLAVFAYLFIFDKSQNANTHIPEIALKKPGFKTTLVYLPIGKAIDKVSFLSGSKSIYKVIAVSKIEEIGTDKLVGVDLYGKPFQEDLQLYPSFTENNIVSYFSLFGTDRYGRDIFSRLALGLRISFIVGFLSVLISVFIGILVGLAAGYFRGWVDKLVMFLINTFWSVPTILLVFAIVIGFGRSVNVIFIAIGLTMWIEVARLVRGLTLQTREKTYITAASSMGIPSFAILIKHILPNIIGPVVVLIAANFAIAILIEAGLSYLGFGVQPPVPSLGNMLNENYGYAISGNIWIALFPALAIMLLVLSFNLIGNTLSNIFGLKDRI